MSGFGWELEKTGHSFGSSIYSSHSIINMVVFHFISTTYNSISP